MKDSIAPVFLFLLMPLVSVLLPFIFLALPILVVLAVAGMTIWNWFQTCQQVVQRASEDEVVAPLQPANQSASKIN